MTESVTQLLGAWRSGDDNALDQLTPLVYNELRRLAGRYMQSERAGHTLQATAVVNEAFMRMVDMDVPWQNRAHFFAIAARLMRRILVDHAKAHRREKRGGKFTDLTLDEGLVEGAQEDPDMISLDQALHKLEGFDERKAQVVELHYFGGLTYKEIAEALEMSEATVDRDLRMAKAWLQNELSQ
ncbi:MAG: sigma-70 family RNA polymerase sigma factor [Gammaproteobacteria bacterium]